MAGEYLSGYAYVAFFLIAGPVFLVFCLFLSRLLHPKRKTKEKLGTYESGESPVGPAWVQVPLHFYLYALLFVVFDVEALFFLVWAMNVKAFGSAQALLSFVEMLVFVVILVGGLLYAWRKGALKWV